MRAVTEKEAYHIFLNVYNKLLDNQDILKAMLNQLLELQTKVMFTRPDIVELNEKISELLSRIIHSQGCGPKGALILLFL